jgi:quinoprotein glucose dehydrogenase
MRRFTSIVLMFCLLIILSSCANEKGPLIQAGTDWPSYLGDAFRSHYSPLRQINKSNVDSLQVAWEYHTYDADKEGRTQIQCNPLVINGVVYGTSPKLKLFALDARSGKQIWMFDPSVKTSFALNVNRGVAYWQEGEDKRLFYTAGPYLYAINADTGHPIHTFGIEGRTSLKLSLGAWAQPLYVSSTTPGVVYKDMLIMGTRLSEGVDAAPGHIRAYDVRTGKVSWAFETIPKPGAYGYETWPEDAYQRVGGANSWAGMSLDAKRGIVFVPTGSAAYDFYGGNRKGSNLFANCLLALNADTGERLWHFQTVHHDVLDRDLPAPPNLLTVDHDGKRVDAVAQITKAGYVFLFERETGKPLFPIEERPVPQSDLPGEETWPTQPFPLKPPPFTRQAFTLSEITDINPESHRYVSGIMKNVRTGGPFLPPSREGSIVYPGFDGGGEWGGAAVDTEKGILYVNANEMAWILTMFDIHPETGGGTHALGATLYQANCAMCHGLDMSGDPTGVYPALKDVGTRMSRSEIRTVVEAGRNFMPGWEHLGDRRIEAVIDYILSSVTDVEMVRDSIPVDFDRVVPYRHTGYNRFFDQLGYPAIKPPWGTLSAIDLNRGEILWQKPLGEFEALTEQGIPKTGTENYGGPVLTAGGLIFIGASQDEYFRAFDQDTGEELWKYKLPAGGYATPAVYEVDGRQYIVIACGGGKMGTRSGDSYLAFALP